MEKIDYRFNDVLPFLRIPHGALAVFVVFRLRLFQAICFSLAVLFLLSCSNPDESNGSRMAQAKWYLLERGRFKKTESFENLPPGELGAWTYKQRVADIAYEHGKVIFGINGFGVAFIEAGSLEEPVFHYFFDESLFAGNTFTSMIPFGDDACCHFYFNSSLAPDEHNTPQKANFAFFPTKGIQDRFTPYILPLQNKREGYEAVGFLPKTKLKWFIEWKKSGRATSFDYSVFDMQSEKEAAISRQDYRAAFTFTDINDPLADPATRVLCRKAMASTGLSETGTTFHFLVKQKDTNLIDRYIRRAFIELSDEEYEIENVHMFRDSGGVYCLIGNSGIMGVLFGSGATEEMSLPRLPEGYAYSGFFIVSGIIFISWEERAFYKTGNAGLGILRLAWD